MKASVLEPISPKAGQVAVADFTPVTAISAMPSAAEACLEEPFRPELEDMLSFLVNGFWLIGSHRILEWEAGDPRVAEGLRAMGHAVEEASRAAGIRAGAFDRAMSLSRALGYAEDGDPRAWLKAMNRALRPGGLLLFHVLDRDRAWGLVRDFTSREGAAGIAFDPRSGEVTVRASRKAAADAPREGAAAGTRQAVRAFNLGEVQALLTESGFALERAYGDWKGGSVEEEGELSGRILVVASKPRRRPALRKPLGSALRGVVRDKNKQRKEGGGGT